MQHIRIWDLPTRLFHWLLAAAVVGLLVSANIGGDAMLVHMRLGYAVFTLLLFRLAWGVVGGHWSRFASFMPTPGRLRRYLRGQASAAEQAGHSPLGALSVLAMLLVLCLQVGTGLCADDEIAYSGPLAARVSGAAVALASRYHTTVGKLLVIALVLLHLLAIARYQMRGRKLIGPMLTGDKVLAEHVPAARDGAAARLLALLVLALAAGVVYAVVQWGQAAVPA